VFFLTAEIFLDVKRELPAVLAAGSFTIEGKICSKLILEQKGDTNENQF
jgi:hypothetical protein